MFSLYVNCNTEKAIQGFKLIMHSILVFIKKIILFDFHFLSLFQYFNKFCENSSFDAFQESFAIKRS